MCIDKLTAPNIISCAAWGLATELRAFPSLPTVFRRRGATWFESRIGVMTVPGSASSQVDCPLSPPATGDYCHLTQEVVFQVGVVTQEVTIQLIDDQVAEGQETFYVQLVEGEGLTNAILHGNVMSMVNIEDTEDCELDTNDVLGPISFSLPLSVPLPPSLSPYPTHPPSSLPPQTIMSSSWA